MTRRLGLILASLVLALALTVAPAVFAAAPPTKNAAKKKSLPDPNKGTKAAASKKGLPQTGVSVLGLSLTGIFLIVAGRALMPNQPLAAPTFDRYLFEVQRRRFIAGRR